MNDTERRQLLQEFSAWLEDERIMFAMGTVAQSRKERGVPFKEETACDELTPIKESFDDLIERFITHQEYEASPLKEQALGVWRWHDGTWWFRRMCEKAVGPFANSSEAVEAYNARTDER
jgi:hypothetical protein